MRSLFALTFSTSAGCELLYNKYIYFSTPTEALCAIVPGSTYVGVRQCVCKLSFVLALFVLFFENMLISLYASFQWNYK